MSMDSARAAPQDHTSRNSSTAAVSSGSGNDCTTADHHYLLASQKQEMTIPQSHMQLASTHMQSGSRAMKEYPMAEAAVHDNASKKSNINNSSEGATAKAPTKDDSDAKPSGKQPTSKKSVNLNGSKTASVTPPSQSSASSSPQVTVTANDNNNGDTKPKPAKGRKKRGRPPRSRSGDSGDAESNTNGSAHHNNGKYGAAGPLVMPLTKKFVANGESSNKKTSNTKEFRWRAHRATEDYVALVGNIMYPGTYMGPFGYSHEQGQYPVERPCMLGLLQSPLRHPTVIERWSPYEIASFEAAMTLYGKEFHAVQKVVKTKTTKEIVEFYYIWKKTSHYKRWKEQFEHEVESEDEEIMDLRPGKKSKG